MLDTPFIDFGPSTPFGDEPDEDIIITATVAPAAEPLEDGDLLSSIANFATLDMTGNYASSASPTIASVQWLVDGVDQPGTYALSAGQSVVLRVTDGDTPANFREWTIDDDVAAAAPSAFDLPDLFAASEAGGAWHIHPDHCYTDTARTTNAVVGDPVAGITDRSGNGWHGTQAVLASRPILRQAISGNYYLEFDGVDDFFVIGTFATAAAHYQALGYDTQSETFGALWSIDGFSPVTNRWASGSTGAIGVNGFTFQSLRVDGVSSAPADMGAMYTAVTGRHVLVFHNTSTLPNQTWRFGRSPASAYNLSGDVYGGMIWRDRLSAAEQTDLEAWLTDRTG